MKTTLILAVVINSLFIFYGSLNYSRMNTLATKCQTTKNPQAPTDEEWAMFTDPKHHPFLRDHIGRLTSNVHDLSNSTYLGAKALRSQSVILSLTSLTNFVFVVVMYLQQKKRATS
jgi:hypothetical protein